MNEKKYFVGQRVATDDCWLRSIVKQHGADPDNMVVRGVDARGWPVFSWEEPGERAGYNPECRLYREVKQDRYYLFAAKDLTAYGSVEQAEEAVKLQGSLQPFVIMKEERRIKKQIEQVVTNVATIIPA